MRKPTKQDITVRNLRSIRAELFRLWQRVYKLEKAVRGVQRGRR